ncbi:uncharacterized protein LOC120844621 [Ixodes scapularis]|uniref:uncharacterized protein LOC120844621 n=1 Tax=Ixodes scapularis TaxID=6945 RepID=UPI001A9E89C0|nr:uncharacterized protein LOC120844621 [Ixodes scapularis]
MVEEEGNTHVLVCLDHATRYVNGSAVPNTVSIYYIKFLTKRWIPRLGVPEMIITDQARGFVNRNKEIIHRPLGVTHTRSPPYWPEANGLIERMVGTITEVLRKLVDNRPSWHIVLPDAVTAANVTRQSSTLYNPLWLIHGNDPELTGELNVGSVDDDFTETEKLLNLVRSRSVAKLSLDNSQTLAKVWYEADVKAPSFNVGDFVYCSKGSRCGTLDSLFEGPYKIAQFNDRNTVLLKRAVPIEDRSNSRLVNLQKLRRCVAKDIEPVKLSDTTIGQALANQVEKNRCKTRSTFQRDLPMVLKNQLVQRTTEMNWTQ